MSVPFSRPFFSLALGDLTDGNEVEVVFQGTAVRLILGLAS